MIDTNSKTTKKDRNINSWNKRRIELHLKAAKVLAQQKYQTDDLTALTKKQLEEIVRSATKKPNQILRGAKQ